MADEAGKGLRGERFASHSMGGSHGGTCEYGFGLSVRSLTSSLGAGGGGMEMGRLKSPVVALPVLSSTSTSAKWSSSSSGHRTGREGAPMVLALSGSSMAPMRQFGEVRKRGEKDGEETGGADGNAIGSVGNGVGSRWLDRRYESKSSSGIPFDSSKSSTSRGFGSLRPSNVSNYCTVIPKISIF